MNPIDLAVCGSDVVCGINAQIYNLNLLEYQSMQQVELATKNILVALELVIALVIGWIIVKSLFSRFI